jgi:hypothetical protein
MRVSESVPALLSGMSYQDPRLRLPSHVRESLNAIPHPVYGLRKRPGTTFRGYLTRPGVHYQWFTPPSGVRYLVVIGAAFVDAYEFDSDPTSPPQPVSINIPDFVVPGYLSNVQPNRIRTVQIQDKLLILNRDKVADEVQVFNADSDINQALVWVKQGAYDNRYRIILDGRSFTRDTPGTDATQITTEEIARQLYLRLTDGATADSLYVLANYDVQIQENVILIRRKPGSLVFPDLNTPINIQVDDRNANNYMTLTANRVQRFSDLPSVAARNMRVLVSGSAESSVDDYWVIFVPSSQNNTFGPGIWEETVQLGEAYQPDPATMPLALREDPTGLVLERLDWAERTVGDRTLIPRPSFTGQAIQDMFIYKNRLGFMTRGSVVLSRPGKYTEFYRTTATKTLDDDPIDIASSHPRMTSFISALPLDDSLLLFGDLAQFTLDSQGPLTVKSAELRFRSAHDISTKFRPFSVESVAYAMSAGDEYVREFYRDQGTDRIESVDVVQHVPGLVSRFNSVDVCAPAKLAFWFDPSNNQRDIICYKWLFDGPSQKLQSAWGRWRMSGLVLGIASIETSTFFILQTQTGTLGTTRDAQPRVEMMDLSEASIGLLAEDRLSFESAALDCKAYIPLLSDFLAVPPTPNALYTYTIPHQFTDPVVFYTEFLPLENPNGSSNSFYQIATQLSENASNQYTVSFLYPDSVDPLYGGTYIGNAFEYSVELSPLYARDKRQKLEPAITSGRLQVRSIDLNYSKCGYLKVTVQPERRDPVVKTIEHIDVSGDPSIETTLLSDGTARVPIGCRNTDYTLTISNSSPSPGGIIGYDWDGMIVQTAVRI